MNDILKAISERWSCRAYTNQKLTQEQVQSIALAGVQAPSAMNLQNWRVIMVTNQELIAEIESEGMANIAALPDKSTYERIMSRGGALFYHATCLAIIPIVPGNTLDCGIVTENIALAATSLGVGSVICGLAGFAFAGDKREYFKKKLGFPDGYELGMTVLIGYPAAEGKPHEPDFGKISYII